MLRQSDYFMRYIDRIGDYLLRLANGERDEELDRLIAEAIGVPLEQLEDLPESFLRAHLEAHDVIDPWRAMMASELALTVGRVRDDERRPLAAAFLYERAATLLGWALTGDLSIYAERVAAHADTLAAALRRAETTTEARALMMRSAERLGRYAAAEDLLFGLAREGWPGALAAGEAFFARLAALQDDHDLVSGGLTRDEVDDGLAELRRICAKE